MVGQMVANGPWCQSKLKEMDKRGDVAFAVLEAESSTWSISVTVGRNLGP